jgi:hypothetical protein
LRYLVFVKGEAERFLLVLPLLASGKKKVSLVASVFDVSGAKEIASVNAAGEGQWLVGLYYLLPIVVPSFPESQTCAELGEGVARFFSGKEP